MWFLWNTSKQNKQKELARLRMENKLLRDFLQFTGSEAAGKMPCDLHESRVLSSICHAPVFRGVSPRILQLCTPTGAQREGCIPAEIIREKQNLCFKTYGYRRMWLESQRIQHNPRTILIDERSIIPWLWFSSCQRRSRTIREIYIRSWATKAQFSTKPNWASVSYVFLCVYFLLTNATSGAVKKNWTKR